MKLSWRCGSGLWLFGARGRWGGGGGRVGGGRPRRDDERGEQARARRQLSGRGLLRKPVAGVDVRGDGTFVPFKGGVVREELDPTDHDTPFDLVRETLEAEDR